MNRDELLRRLRSAFLQELEEHVEALNHGLLELEKLKSSDSEELAEILKKLFRTAHTLKGAARSAGVEPIEAASHQLESILAGFRDGYLSPGKEVFAVLFDTIDAIEAAGKLLKEDRDLSAAGIAQILPALEAAASGASVNLPVAPQGDPQAEQGEELAAGGLELNEDLPVKEGDGVDAGREREEEEEVLSVRELPIEASGASAAPEPTTEFPAPLSPLPSRKLNQAI